ncbi:SGNH/GDSL hydrolase family protein [Methylorubrum extorquens]|uniref:SGNH/GDSL hydrolase family protein n=1 Tax=Methylorubrum extorquens TaxID=408 RepID=UPI001EE60A2E|nr:SGNH/GDSL hydrolase family protein [Methylorubrum extorquens]MCG5247989.1 SGNH/GDSL hydrolase family protein [Methylorubrum extorquens]
MAENGIRTSNVPLGPLIEVLGHVDAGGGAKTLARASIAALADALRDIVADDPSGVAGVRTDLTGLSNTTALIRQEFDTFTVGARATDAALNAEIGKLIARLQQLSDGTANTDNALAAFAAALRTEYETFVTGARATDQAIGDEVRKLINRANAIEPDVARALREVAAKQPAFDLAGLLDRIARVNAGVFAGSRPGDTPSAFTALVAGGDPDKVPPLNLTLYPARTVSNGIGVEVTNSREVWSRKLHSIKPGQVFQAFWGYNRTRNPQDPDGDAVTGSVALFGPDRNLITVVRAFADTPAVADGPRSFQAFVGDAGAAGVTIARPTGAAYFSVGFNAFGNEGRTVLTDLGASDVTAVRDAVLALVPGETVPELSARIDAETARAKDEAQGIRDSINVDLLVETVEDSQVLAKRSLARQQLLMPPKIIIGGDSIINQGTIADSANGGMIATTSYGEIEAALCMDRRFTYANWLNPVRPLGFDGANGGVSGERMDQLLLRMPDLLAMGPNVFGIACVTNNVLQSIPNDTTKADVVTGIRMAIASGVTHVPVATMRGLGFEVAPFNTVPGALMRDARVEINNWIRALPAAYPQVILVDLAAAYDDTARPTGRPGDFLPKAGALRDGIHPSPFGAWACGGPVWRDAFRRFVPKFRAFMPFDVDNLLAAAPFGGAGGTLDARCSGVLPNGMKLSMSSGSSTILARQKDVGFDPYYGPRNRRIALEISPSGASGYEQFTIEHISATDVRHLAGQYVQFWADTELQGWEAWGNVFAYVVDQNNLIHMQANAPFNPATDQMGTGATSVMLQTPPFRLPADGSITTLRPVIRGTFFPSGSTSKGLFDLSADWLGPVDDPRPIYNRALF